jgi:hypothetical protein
MISFTFNLPYTLVGLFLALISVPYKMEFRRHPYAVIISIKKFWWLFGYMKNGRAMAVGHVVILGPNLERNDLEHELIHVEQYSRELLIHPILYYIELWRKGYRNNKYEVEAYEKAGNVYRGK